MSEASDHATRLISDRVRTVPLLAIVNILGVSINLWLILAYAADATLPAKLSLLLSITGVAFFSVLPARSLFADVDALRRDAAAGNSPAYAKELASKPIWLFVTLSIGLNALIAMVQTWALFSA